MTASTKQQLIDSGWKKCANEHERCPIPTNNYRILYGVPGINFTRRFEHKGFIGCNNAHFGHDPVPNQVKECWIRPRVKHAEYMDIVEKQETSMVDLIFIIIAIALIVYLVVSIFCTSSNESSESLDQLIGGDFYY